MKTVLEYKASVTVKHWMTTNGTGNPDGLKNAVSHHMAVKG